MLSLRLRRAEVVDGRKIKRTFVPQHPAARVGCGQRRVIAFCRRVGRVVLEHEHLKIVVPGIFVKARKAALEVVNMVFVRDQHADERVGRQLVPDLESPRRALHRPGLARQPDPGEVRVDRPLAGRDRVGLGLHAGGRRTGVAAPDIEHFLDVLDPFRLLGQPQQQIVILRALKFQAFPRAGFVEQRTGEAGQVGDVVAAAQIVGREIRLEVVAAELFQRSVEHNFIGIDKIRARLLDDLHTFKQRIRIKQVVVVKQDEVFAGRQRKPGRRVAGDALVFHFFIKNPRVFRSPAAGKRAGLGVVAVRSIDKHELPVPVSLALHARDHLLKEPQRRVVHRHNDADFGPLQVGRALGFQLAAQRDIGAVPPGIVVEGQPDPEGHIPPELFGPLFAQGGGAAAGQVGQMGRVRQPARHPADAVGLRDVRRSVFVLVGHGGLLFSKKAAQRAAPKLNSQL